MRKFIMAIAALVSIGAGAGAALGLGGPLLDRLTGGSAEEADEGGRRGTAVETAMAEEAEFVEMFPAIGSTQAIRSVGLNPRTAGIVTGLDIPSGQRVEAGHEIVRFDDRAERAVLRQTEARLREAELALQRARQLADRNVTADAALESAEAAHALFQAEADAARVAVADRRVVAPFAGTLGISDVDLGERLETTDVVVTLDDLSEIELLFTLPETFYGEVRPGQPLTATRSSDGRVFGGEVELVDTRVDPAARFFQVRGRFDNSDGALAPGMFMEVRLVVDTRRSVAVPETAIVNVADQAFVFVPVEGEARERAVRVGLYRDGAVEILEGLEAGESVVTTRLQSIADGNPVRAADGAAKPSVAALPGEAQP